jgi:hypothetical protein
VKLTLTVAALVGLAVWLAQRARQTVPDFPQTEKLRAFRQFEQQVTEEARRRLALAADEGETV